MRTAVGIGATLACISHAASAASITVGPQIGETDDSYASWNIDSSCNRAFHQIDFTNKNLRIAAQALAPSRLRFGGSGNDYLVYGMSEGSPECAGIVPAPAPPNSQCAYRTPGCLNSTHWDAFYGFADEADAEFLFGISFDFPAQEKAGASYVWNATNAASLLKYMQAKGQKIWGFELGNEVSNKLKTQPTLTPEMQADALVLLSNVAKNVFPDAKYVGPDTTMVDWTVWVPRYLNRTRDILYAATFHDYNQMTPTNWNTLEQLNKSVNMTAEFVSLMKAANTSALLWGGELGPHTGGNDGTCGDSVCGEYASGWWYVDELGLRAANGLTHHQRQDFFGARYGLTNSVGEVGRLFANDTLVLRADYWTNFIWKRTVGTEVLKTVSSDETVRAYSFAGTPPSKYAAPECKSAKMLILLNIDANVTATVTLPSSASGLYAAWTMTPPAEGPLSEPHVVLNGQVLPSVVDVGAGGGIPSFLEEIPVAARSGKLADGYSLPPLSATFMCY